MLVKQGRVVVPRAPQVHKYINLHDRLGKQITLLGDYRMSIKANSVLAFAWLSIAAAAWDRT